ncbi:hypothetical protein [Peptoniphilus catoniae]|uniref:hypothetical protein n=1 Tax=Peptoniphilus catoniae TaxID=1660341 RepID=UPI0010FF05CA|nr:hypothetical protein [Peptoniphilus catoniae]
MKLSTYMENTYKYGIIATLIAMAIMLGIPLAVCLYFGSMPSFSLVSSVAGTLLALYVPTVIAEQLSMIPVAGTTCYLNSILGNVMNIKFPCYLSALDTAQATPGTEKADVIGMIAVTVSGMVTMIILAIGVLLLKPLGPVLENEAVITGTKYILPALYGSMGITAFMGTKAGSYTVKRKPLVAIIDLILVFGFIFFVMSLEKKEGYAMLVMLVVSVLVALGLYKAGIIKMEKTKKE